MRLIYLTLVSLISDTFSVRVSQTDSSTTRTHTYAHTLNVGNNYLLYNTFVAAPSGADIDDSDTRDNTICSSCARFSDNVVPREGEGNNNETTGRVE